MRFETRTVGVFEVLSVHLEGEEVFDAGRLRQENLRLVEKGSRRIVVDLSGIDYLYSDSINAFVALNRRLLESSGRLGILVPHPKVHEILVRAGLENIMRLYRSEADLLGDSRELMRQSSAWTRPAELVNQASASQILTATNLAPRNSTDAAREAASATQRIQRRRSGPRVEVRPRRRGGRGSDQGGEDDVPLPPQLPSIGSESSSLRNLSLDSSAFLSAPSEAERRRVTPPPEPKVFELPKEPQHDGYSTDAWLLALSPQPDTVGQPALPPAPPQPPSHTPSSRRSAANPAAESHSRFDANLQWDAETPPPAQAFVPPAAPPPPPAPPAFTPPAAWAPPAPPPGPANSFASAFLDPQQPLPPPAASASQAAVTQAIFHDHPSQGSRGGSQPSYGADSYASVDSSGSRSATDPWATERDSSTSGRSVPDPAWPPAPRSTPPKSQSSQVAQPSPTAQPHHSHQDWIEAAERQDAAKPASSRFSPESAPSQSSDDATLAAARASAWFEQPATAVRPQPVAKAAPVAPPSAPKPVNPPVAPPRTAAPTPPNRESRQPPPPPAPPPAPRVDPSTEDAAVAAARASAWFEQPATPRNPPRPTGRQIPLPASAPKPSPLVQPKPAPVREAKVAAPPPAAPAAPLTTPDDTAMAAARASAWFEQPAAPTKPLAPNRPAQAAPPPPPVAAPPAPVQRSAPATKPTKSGIRQPLDPWEDPDQRAAAASAWFERTPTSVEAEEVPQRRVPEPPTPPASLGRPSPSNDRVAADEWFAQNSRSSAAPASAPARVAPNRPPPPRSAPSRTSSLPALEDSGSFSDDSSGSKKSLWIAIAGGGLLLVGLLVWFLAFKKQTAEIPVLPPETTADSISTPGPVASTPVQPVPPPHVEPTPPANKAVAPPPAAHQTVAKTPASKPERVVRKPEPTPSKPVAVAPPPPPPLPPEGDPVKVMISSRPLGATILLDGRSAGVTPAQITVRRVGKLEFNKVGFHSVIKQIDPDENPGRIEVQLQPNDGGTTTTGRIYITSAPSGADIMAGGKNMGKTPRFVELPVGAQKLTLRSGPLAQTRTLEIRSGTNPAEHFGL